MILKDVTSRSLTFRTMSVEAQKRRKHLVCLFSCNRFWYISSSASEKAKNVQPERFFKVTLWCIIIIQNGSQWHEVGFWKKKFGIKSLTPSIRNDTQIFYWYYSTIKLTSKLISPLTDEAISQNVVFCLHDKNTHPVGHVKTRNVCKTFKVFNIFESTFWKFKNLS